MKAHEVEVGRPYFFETSRTYTSTYGDGLVILLTTSTYRESLVGSPRFLIHERGDQVPRGRRTGMLALKVRQASSVKPEQIELLQSVSLLDVAENLYEVPKHVQEQITGYVEVTVVLPRYLVGDWSEIVSARVAQEQAERKRQRAEQDEALLRTERWEDVFGVIEKLKGETTREYRLTEFGTPEHMKIRLEDMEMLTGLAKKVLPHLFEKSDL